MTCFSVTPYATFSAVCGPDPTSGELSSLHVLSYNTDHVFNIHLPNMTLVILTPLQIKQYDQQQ